MRANYLNTGLGTYFGFLFGTDDDAAEARELAPLLAAEIKATDENNTKRKQFTLIIVHIANFQPPSPEMFKRTSH